MTDFERKVDALAKSWFPDGEPGGAVLIRQGDRILFDRGYGLADLETGLPNNGDTFFNIASISKQFTAVALLQLAQAGKVKLSDPVCLAFPELSDAIWKKITWAHLLSHSSGIPDERDYLTEKQQIFADEKVSMEYLYTLDHLHFEPGTAYEYINPTFDLCGALVERLSGQPFTDYVRDHLFLPAGMDETLYFDRDHEERIPRRSHGYERDNGVWSRYEFGTECFFATRPDGGIYTSTHEFVRWLDALKQGKILPESLLSKAFSGQTLVSGSAFSGYQNRENTYYGYGWFIEPTIPGQCEKVIYHTGDNGGYKALEAWYPESDRMILVFANRADWDRSAGKVMLETLCGLRKE